MKTNQQNSQPRVRRLSTLIGLAVTILFGCSQHAFAQEWSPAGSNTYKTNTTGNVGIGITNPGTYYGVAAKLDVSSTTNGIANINSASGYSGGLGFSRGGASDWFISNRADATTGRLALFDNVGNERVTFLQSGNVGIGTTSPAIRLESTISNSGTGQYASASYGLKLTNSNTTANNWVGLLMGNSSGAATVIETKLTDHTNFYGELHFGTRGGAGLASRMVIDQSGNVGIGTTSPGTYYTVPAKLDVSSSSATLMNINGAAGSTAGLGFSENGSAKWLISSRNTADTPNNRLAFFSGGGTEVLTLKSDGNVNVAGSINAKYQDVAEWVPASEQIPTGTVVVLDSTKSNQVIASTVSYDTRVAGVISERPGLALGESGDNKVLVATTGRVRVNVDATKTPIHIGDLLVTSDLPGVAMKSEPIEIGGRLMHMPGTLIGKALESLEKGSGKILVLLSLQ